MYSKPRMRNTCLVPIIREISTNFFDYEGHIGYKRQNGVYIKHRIKNTDEKKVHCDERHFVIPY